MAGRRGRGQQQSGQTETTADMQANCRSAGTSLGMSEAARERENNTFEAKASAGIAWENSRVASWREDAGFVVVCPIPNSRKNTYGNVQLAERGDAFLNVKQCDVLRGRNYDGTCGACIS